jgi:hypothetical protein
MWRKFAVAVAVLGSMQGLGTAAASKPERPGQATLSVSVFNDAGVAPDVLSRAQVRAEATMAEAGIALSWLDCGTPGHWATGLGCADLAFPSHLSVRLVRNGTHRGGDVFGESFLDARGQGNYASVYVDPLTASPAHGAVGEGDLLGYVIAHEVGHLLLGPDSHSGAGVMHGVWGFADLQEAAQGRLHFRREEGQRLQARLLGYSARREAQKNGMASGK